MDDAQRIDESESSRAAEVEELARQTAAGAFGDLSTSAESVMSVEAAVGLEIHQSVGIEPSDVQSTFGAVTDGPAGTDTTGGFGLGNTGDVPGPMFGAEGPGDPSGLLTEAGFGSDSAPITIDAVSDSAGPAIPGVEGAFDFGGGAPDYLAAGMVGLDDAREAMPAFDNAHTFPETPDPYQISYASNLSIGDSYVNLTNVGPIEGDPNAGSSGVGMPVESGTPPADPGPPAHDPANQAPPC